MDIARLRRTSPDFDGTAIVLDNPAIEIADAGGDREQFEYLVGGAHRLFQRKGQYRRPAPFKPVVAHRVPSRRLTEFVPLPPG
jgi:hypothetical protein